MTRNKCKYEDNHVYLEIAGQNLLFEKGFNIDTQIKIVKEGEEPVQLLKHLSCFLLDKDLEIVGLSNRWELYRLGRIFKFFSNLLVAALMSCIGIPKQEM